MSPTTSSRSSAALVPRAEVGRLCLRADGGGGVGAGHVGRCLALAEAWERAGGTAVLVLTDEAAAHARHMGASVEVAVVDVDPGTPEDAEATAAIGEGGWLVVDGYRFGSWPSPTGEHVLALDDFGHGGGGPAELILDQNLGATAEAYASRPHERLLLGPSFALLRGGESAARSRRRGAPRRVVLPVGGEANEAVLRHVGEVVRALDRRGLALDVVGGVHSGDLPAVDGLRVHGFVADPNDLLASADLAVAVAGSTVYALCRHGVPSVVIPFHDNQVPIAEAFAAAGVALTPTEPAEPAATVALVERLLDDDVERERLGAAAARLVDGHGAARVVDAVLGR